jgi:hypothetical protein
VSRWLRKPAKTGDELFTETLSLTHRLVSRWLRKPATSSLRRPGTGDRLPLWHLPEELESLRDVSPARVGYKSLRGAGESQRRVSCLAHVCLLCVCLVRARVRVYARVCSPAACRGGRRVCACVRVCARVCIHLRLAGAAGWDDDRGPPHLPQDAVRTSLAAGLYVVSCCRFKCNHLWQVYIYSLLWHF